MRIQKYLSEKKILSRREAERFMLDGKVLVNGKVVTNLATQIDLDKDKVTLIEKPPDILAILFYKPRGVSSDKANTEGKNIFDLLPNFRNLHNVGRLDKESEGAIILTNSGVLTSVVTSDQHIIEKEYIVNVREIIRPTNIKALSSPMRLEYGTTLPAKAKIISDHTFSIILKEGKNHQIRRMANRVHLTINSLKRVRIGNIKLGSLRPGEYRQLNNKEINSLLSFRH